MGVDARDRDREWESRRLRVGLAGRGTSSAAVGVFALVVVAGDAVVRTLDSDDSAALNFFVAAEAEADPLTGVCEREGSLAAEPGTVRSLDDEDWLSGRFGVKGTCERVPRDCPAVDVDIEEVLLVVLVEGGCCWKVVGKRRTRTQVRGSHEAESRECASVVTVQVTHAACHTSNHTYTIAPSFRHLPAGLCRRRHACPLSRKNMRPLLSSSPLETLISSLLLPDYTLTIRGIV